LQIIGTAGHVDHGKSSLVTALTGTNPDRWIEEQRRGMTLDLGFAHLRFDDGREAGIVDVPGHERFLHNMLAGAAGMELLLLVIAANEGVKPQTIEHLNILRFLKVRSVVVALTKMDLVEPARGGAVCRETHEALAGTIAADAPIFAVSVVSGENLDVLKLGLAYELSLLPPREVDAPAYLPVDRVFSLPGRGTIVTGTLMQGRITTGETLSLYPSAKAVRVRSLQVFGEARESASGGSRVALNLASIEKDEVSRGDVLGDAQFEAHRSLRVEFVPLPESRALIRRRTPVRAHIGSAEILGTLVLPAIPTDDAPVTGTLHLRAAVVAFPGARFVLRRVSPKTLLGGGRVSVSTDALERVEQRTGLEEAVLAALRASDGPLSAAAIANGANVREAAAQRGLDALLAHGDILRLERPIEYLVATAATALAARVEAELARLHEAEPWAIGVTSITLARTLGVAEPLLVRALAAFALDGRITARSGYYALPSHQPSLNAAQRAFFEGAMPFDPEFPLLPADFADVASNVKRTDLPGLGKAFDTLLARGTLVKVGDGLYRGTQIADIHARVEGFIATNGRMTMAEFRDLLQTSRKYAVPLLEWFDGRGITLRDGDYRTLKRNA
jgi:selenocysteine-specific elongation factor